MSDTFDHIFDALDREDSQDYVYEPKTCKFCGETDLWWVEIDGNWRLVDGDQKVHDCNKEDKDLENALIEKLKRRVNGNDN